MQEFLNAAVGASYTGPGGELLRQDTVCSQVLWECPCGDIIEALQHALDSYKTKGRTLSTDEIVRIATKRAKERAEAAAATAAAAAAAEAAAATAAAAAEAEATVVGAVAADEQELDVLPAPPDPSPAPTPASLARQLSASQPEPEPEPADAAAQPAGSGGGADQLGPRARPAPGAMAEGARDGAEDDGELSARVVSAANRTRVRYASVGRLEPALLCPICRMPPVDGVKISGGECPCSDNIYCELCILERAESSRPRKPTCSTCPAEFEWRDLKPANMRVHWNVAAMRLRVDVPAVLEEGEE